MKSPAQFRLVAQFIVGIRETYEMLLTQMGR